MARVSFAQYEELTGRAKEEWEGLEKNQKLTNMKKALLQDTATYDAFMGWYKSWGSLVETVGERAAVIYAHAISTTNSCLLCSLFFIGDLKKLGEDPKHLQLNEQEQLLTSLGEQLVKDPTSIQDELFEKLKHFYSDHDIVTIVGFGAQMIATNHFNSALQIDVDERLLPIRDEFEPAVWRENIK